MPSSDEQLAQLLADLTDRVRGGESLDLEAVVREHPQWSAELRQLWAAVMIAEQLADDVRTAQPTEDRAAAENPVEASLPTHSAPLPRRFGEYELLEELGRGGMGIVYKARQTNLGRIVALKLILRGELASSSDVARFRAEAKSAARLEHAGIVPVYEVGEFEGQPYFTMKLVEGTTLAQRLIEGPMSPRETAALLAEVARAIDYAHQRGVLHRDLKPSNILIDDQGRPHVSDFGLAKRIEGGETLTGSGAILGTPSYMAPEQAAGGRGQIGPATDVYSLGTILYQMLTGRPPFQAASPVDTVLLLLEQDPLPPRLVNPRADRDLEMIALRCLQKLPSLRYETAAQLADDLEAYLAGEPVSARSGHITQVVARLFRETHHATVLENWGLLWMLHSAALLLVCLLTNAMKLAGVTSVWPYLGLWTLGLGAWASVFWALRRRAGPVTFVERQIAHLWGASMIAIAVLFWVERLLDRPVLELSPVLALMNGSTFLAKAGILSGRFYIQAFLLFLTAPVMVLVPDYGISIFGLVSAACFFQPGLKYYRQRGNRASE
jgi:serine/threonine-protein kinase